MLEFILILLMILVAIVPSTINATQVLRGKKVTAREWTLGAFWALGVFSLSLIANYALGVWVEVMWFNELKAHNRYLLELKTYWGLFVTATAFAVACFWFMIAQAYRLQERKKFLEDSPWLVYINRSLAAISSVLFGFMIAGQWQEFLLWRVGVGFGVSDPIFSKDVGFYVYSLPFWNSILFFGYLLLGLLVVPCIVTYVTYLIFWLGDYAYDSGRRGTRVDSEALEKLFWNHTVSHLSLFVIGLIALLMTDTFLSRYSILYSDQGSVFGAGYTDVHYALPGIWVLLVAYTIAIGLFLVAFHAKALKKTVTFAAVGVGLPLAVWLICLVIVPSIFHRNWVGPNEFAYEQQYLQHDLDFTKRAFRLDAISKSDFPATADVSKNIFQTDAVTLDNMRLWTPDALRAVNSNRQLFRTYYGFSDVDVDRYHIGGKQVQVMLSARELASDHLPAATWQNVHLVYTHGYGLTMSPVNSFTPEGLPEYLIKDVPPVSKFKELEITQPRIYFGESTYEHVYVGTSVMEFDFPKGDENSYNHYDGPAGVAIGSGLRRFALALQFDGLRLLTADEIKPESRILFRRQLGQRLGSLAPFLTFESDMYQVLDNGQLWFIQDGYTSTDHYPYSKPSSNGWNYVRNSVKVVLNSYTGEVKLYVSDPSDPIIQSYQILYPELFTPLTQMPEGLRSHLRYPETLLKLQAEMLATYHMGSAQLFYNKEDYWQISHAGSMGKDSHPMEPYYVSMVRPGKNELEFMLMLPFSPLSPDPAKPARNNLVAWLAGECDGENLGKLVLYTFQKDQNVEGPLQVWARTNQNEIISKDFTLWNTNGSQVMPGNLIVVPLSNNQLLYVQPIYLQSTQGKMPEIKRVVTATQGQIGYGSTFAESLSNLFGQQQSAVAQTNENGEVAPTKSAVTPSVLKQAQALMDTYQRENAAGNYDKAGAALKQLSQLLKSAK